MQRIPMTAKGADALRAELEKLKREDRPRITAAIAEAREHGDLKENAEYHAAREQQGFCEGRINEIESKLGAAQIIDITELEIGSTLHVSDIAQPEGVEFLENAGNPVFSSGNSTSGTPDRQG